MNESLLKSVGAFVRYHESIRRRTLNFIRAIPAERIDWSPATDEFTLGDLIRHLAATESMFVRAIAHHRWIYDGHTTPKGSQTLEDVISVLDASHHDAVEALGNVKDVELIHYRPSLDGEPVRVWRLLMAMVEHEIHHRSQLAMYLTLIHVKPPHIYGLGVEDVIARATG